MARVFLTNEDKPIILNEAKESVSNPDVHAEYFQITDDGVVSLKPEYRGAADRQRGEEVSDNGIGVAGSQNAELPKHLVVPEIVDGKIVLSLAIATFRYNHALESATLPGTISEISDYCFDNCWYLKNVYNAANIKSIGKGSFQRAGLVRLRFPNLERLDQPATFVYCDQLVYADIGSVGALKDSVFDGCHKLNMVKSKNAITSVGNRCFYRTYNLKHADFSGLKTAGALAFLRSGVDFDPDLDTKSFGANATYLQYSPADSEYWSTCTFTDCTNSLPTHLCQMYSQWANRHIGGIDTNVTFGNGCLFFVIMHTYCGLHNVSYRDPRLFEMLADEISPNWSNQFTASIGTLKAQAESLGLKVDLYPNFDKDSLQALYDALAEGKYGIIAYDEAISQTQSVNHLVVAYGINAKGELLVADSESANYGGGNKEPLKYALPIYKLVDQASTGYALHIVSL